jgi:2-polyprenyl-3-methyl-5-hydroxy-6-metoxy-1,4-benzoquinol methylase
MFPRFCVEALSGRFLRREHFTFQAPRCFADPVAWLLETSEVRNRIAPDLQYSELGSSRLFIPRMVLGVSRHQSYDVLMAGISYQYTAAKPSASHSYLYPAVSGFLEGLPAGSVVLDAGCGNGTFLSLFSDRGWKLHGSDFSPAGLEFARSTFPDIRFFLADAQSLYKEFLAMVGPADAVISTEVIEHLYDPRSFANNCYSLLRPGGTLVLSTPYHGYLKNLLLALSGKMEFHYDALRLHGHIKFFSRATIEKLLTDAGFVDIEFTGAGRIPHAWKSMVLKASRPAL